MTNQAKTFLFICLMFLGCNNHHQESGIIEGKFQNCTDEKITLLELNAQSVIRVDSLVLDSGGRFIFSVKPEGPGFYMLQSNQGKVMVLYMDRGDTITLTGDFVSFPDRIKLKGSEEAEKLESFFLFTRKNERKVDSLETLLIENQDSSGFYQLTLQIDTAFRKIWDSQRDFGKTFIDRNPGSLSSLIVLNYAFGLHTVLSPDEDQPFFRKLDSTLMNYYPQNKHVLYHHQRMLEFQREQQVKKSKKL